MRAIGWPRTLQVCVTPGVGASQSRLGQGRRAVVGLVRRLSRLNRCAVGLARSLCALAGHAAQGQQDHRGQDAQHNDDDEEFNKCEPTLVKLSGSLALLNLLELRKHDVLPFVLGSPGFGAALTATDEAPTSVCSPHGQTEPRIPPDRLRILNACPTRPESAPDQVTSEEYGREFPPFPSLLTPARVPMWLGLNVAVSTVWPSSCG